MDKIYYIENTIDEYHSIIVGYFATFDEAKDALKDCCDWYRPNGTGRIYEIEFGLDKQPKLVFEKR